MAFPTARKRNNPFAERVRQQRAQQQQRPAAKPKAEPKPTPEEQRDTDQPLGDLREVADQAEQKAAEVAAAASVGIEHDMDTTEVLSAAERCCGPGGGCERENCTGTPLPDAVDFEREDTTMEPAQPKRGRGRPRPQETIDRDNAVHNVLRSNPAGVSKAELARALGEKEQQVYSSLRQLTKEGRAQNRYVKDVGYRWFAV